MNDENATGVREHLHDAIQHTVSIDVDLPDGALLIGWTTIAEWMAPNGRRWLSIVDGGAQRGDGVPMWQRRGYLHDALFEAPSYDDSADN